MACEKHRDFTISKPYCVFCMEEELEFLRKRVQFYSTSHIGELEIEELAEFAKDLEEDMQRMAVMLKEVEEMIQIKQEEVPRENNPCP